jgi:hypothetical protein
MKRLRLILGAFAAFAALAGLAARPALADYGQGAVYQVEISSNLAAANGGGIWLWIELNSNGAGDYTGSDCGRGAAERAVADLGDVTSWSVSGGVLTIEGVHLNGLGGLQVTITIPLPASGYGHVTTDVVTIFPDLETMLGLAPGVGFSQVEVAP